MSTISPVTASPIDVSEFAIVSSVKADLLSLIPATNACATLSKSVFIDVMRSAVCTIRRSRSMSGFDIRSPYVTSVQVI